MIILFALLIGFVAGLRSMMAPAAVSWAAYAGSIAVAGTWLGFMANPWTVVVLTLLAIGELVADLLPSTPSRTVPLQFSGRVLTGAVSGAAVGAGSGSLTLAALCGVVGATLGTLVGAAGRRGAARVLGSDPAAAVSEDVLALLLGLFAVGLL
jgi:uncharacterized membrane protein